MTPDHYLYDRQTKQSVPVYLKRWRRFLAFFFTRISCDIEPTRYHAIAYRDIRCRENVMVLWPFHYVVQFIAWADFKWAAHRFKKSWIDRQADAGVLRHPKDRELILDVLETALFRMDPHGRHDQRTEAIANLIIRRLRARK